MLKDLLVNASFLIAILFIAGQVFENKRISNLSLIRYKVLLGVIGGISCISLMYYSININSNIFLDFRNIPEVIAAIMGGSIAVIITGILSIFFCLLYFGVSTYTIVISIGIAIVSLGCALFSILKINNNMKCIVMGVFSLVIRTIIFSLLINDTRTLDEVLILLWVGTVIIGTTIYYLMQYLVTAHNVIFQLKESATKDFLTGLHNTRSFDTYFNNSVKSSLEKGEQLSFLMLDIDFF